MSTKKLTLLDDGSLNSKDGFRNKFGSWGADSGGSPTYTKDDHKLSALTLVSTGIGEADDSFLEKKYYMRADTESLDPTYMSNIGPDTVYEDFEMFEDFATEIQVPATTGEDLQAKVMYEYNYYDKKSEEELMKTTTGIVEILSVYGMNSQANQNGTVADQLNYPTADSLIYNKEQNYNTGASEKYKTQMVIGAPASTIGTLEENKNNFPMFVELQIPHNAERNIANEIQDTELAAILMRDVIEDANLESRDQIPLNAYIQTDSGTESYSLSSDSVDLLDYWSLDLGAWEFPVALPSDAMFVSNATNLDHAIDTSSLGIPAAGVQEELADQDGDYTISIAPYVDVFRGALDSLIEKHGRT